MRRHLTGAILALILALAAVPATASAAKITLGEGRRAISRYGSELAQGYESRYHESFPWQIELCVPHGADNKRVLVMLCDLETPTAEQTVWATSIFNLKPRGTRWAADYGRVAVYVEPVKQRH